MRFLARSWWLVLPWAVAAAQAEPLPAIPAQVTARQFTTLSAEVPAKIDRITVKEGDAFKEGARLISLDCTLQQAQMDEARAALEAAESAKRVHKRLLELNSSGTLETEMAIAEAAKARAKLNSAQAHLSKCTINAPFSGRVVERKAQPHQYVQAGQPILDILDDTKLEVEFIVPSNWISLIKIALPVELKVDETGKTYPAHIVRLGAKVDVVSHSLKVIAEIDGSVPALMAGMTGQLLITPTAKP